MVVPRRQQNKSLLIDALRQIGMICPV